jgi:hypothetical protein
MAVQDYFKLTIDGLLLRPRAYEQMAEERQPFQRGLILIILIGVVVAVVGIVGTVLEAATTPNIAEIQQAVFQGLMAMPWYQQAASQSPQFSQSFAQSYNLWWQVFGSAFSPNIVSAVSAIVLGPFALIIGWLIYGLLAHLFARLLGGEASLRQTYGATALGVAPQSLNVIALFPYAQTGGLAMWALLCNFVALKTAHRLTTGRAAWATILPFITLIILAIVLAFLFASLIAAVVGGFAGTGR